MCYFSYFDENQIFEENVCILSQFLCILLLYVQYINDLYKVVPPKIRELLFYYHKYASLYDFVRAPRYFAFDWKISKQSSILQSS